MLFVETSAEATTFVLLHQNRPLRIVRSFHEGCLWLTLPLQRTLLHFLLLILSIHQAWDFASSIAILLSSQHSSQPVACHASSSFSYVAPSLLSRTFFSSLCKVDRRHHILGRSVLQDIGNGRLQSRIHHRRRESGLHHTLVLPGYISSTDWRTHSVAHPWRLCQALAVQGLPRALRLRLDWGSWRFVVQL